MDGDIIIVMPWYCEHDGQETWHKGSYWLYEDGSLSFDSFTDGDHTGDIEESELPTPEQEVKAWAEYRMWAVQHQRDPLDEFMDGVPEPGSERAAEIVREALAAEALS